MNREEFVVAVAARMETPKKDAAAAVEAICAVIAWAAVGGEEIRLAGFGTFAVAVRGASTGRNPRTGEAIDIGERRTLKFRPGKRLRDALQNSRDAAPGAAA